jgi:hypothetical protein
MRIAVLLVSSLLVAGCSHAIDGRGQQTSATASTSPTAPLSTSPATSAAPTAGATSAAPTAGATSAAPTAGAPISEVIAWVEAGSPADATRYHSATRDSVTTELGDDVAFSAPLTKVTCMTDSQHTGGALACLVDLAHPPPQPTTVYGAWQGGWVDFDGANLQVGSAHGDPGPFTNGDGPELPYGTALSFGDYRCRADKDGMLCVNYAHRSAARLAAAGIEPFGCLQPVPAPDGAGEKFSC